MTFDTDTKHTYQLKYPGYASALYESLTADPFYITMEQSVSGQDARQRQAMLRYMDYSMIEAERFGILFIPKVHEYGVSIWSKTLPPETQAQRSAAKKRFLREHMGPKSLETYHAIVETMSLHAQNLVDDRFWYLSIIGILPQFQNQGLGPGLISDILEKADQKGIPTYLETFTPRNISFYQRLGYNSAGVFYEPTVRAEYTLMTRPAMPA
ncbi:MAG: N-acetyltransferase [Desulfobacteraceae bacterium]|nr:MAG: N-acetyltransferase [Desulfobacteraceae bacterium]